MKIISWNVNGIRAAVKKGFLEWFQKTKADIVCLQEVRAEIGQIPVAGRPGSADQSAYPAAQFRHPYAEQRSGSAGRSGTAGTPIPEHDADLYASYYPKNERGL